MLILLISIEIGLSLPKVIAQAIRKRTGVISDNFVLVDGHKMHYHVSGSGSPTVVFEGGVTDDLNS